MMGFRTEDSPRGQVKRKKGGDGLDSGMSMEKDAAAAFKGQKQKKREVIASDFLIVAFAPKKRR